MLLVHLKAKSEANLLLVNGIVCHFAFKYNTVGDPRRENIVPELNV